MSASHVVGILLAFGIWLWAMAERYFRHEAEKDRDYLRTSRWQTQEAAYNARCEYEELQERYQRSARAWRRMARAYLALQYATIATRERPERAPAIAVDPASEQRADSRSSPTNETRPDTELSDAPT